MIEREGVAIVVSAPSGGGKTTLCRRVATELDDVVFSVSYTTRKPRGAERDGVDYHFVDDARFDELLAEGALLEWANVHGRRYGTGRAETEALLKQGKDVFFDIDVQGGRQIADKLPNALLVFVLPPTMATLEERLRARQSDSHESIAARLEEARNEINAASFYPYWLVNDELNEATAALRALIITKRIEQLDRTRLLGSFFQKR